MIPIYRPYLDKYKKSAMNAIETDWISNYGVNVKNSEEKLKNIFNVKYCILMNNGTSATHSLFLALKYKYPSVKKIYIPNNVFIAAWNCALMQYNKEDLTVMQINEQTLNIDTSEEYIQSLDSNSCVLIVHNLGNVVNVPRLKRIRPDIVFIEDNCEGLFGTYENMYTGTSSLCSSCSFYANKTLTTGEGGAFFTNDYDIYKYINSVYSHGMTDKKYIHDKLSYNYRMTNIQAGFLYDQLNDIDYIISTKKKLFSHYDKFLNEYYTKSRILKLEFEKNTIPSNWMYCIIIPNINFESFEKFMNEKLVQIRPFFYDIRRHEHLKDINVDYPENKRALYGIMLPSYPGLELEKIEYICNCIKEYTI